MVHVCSVQAAQPASRATALHCLLYAHCTKLRWKWRLLECRLAEAEQHGRKALELQEAGNGSGSLQYAESLFGMAALHVAQQRWAPAATHSQQCLEIR